MSLNQLPVYQAAVDKARKDLNHIRTGANVHKVNNLEQTLFVVFALREKRITASDRREFEKTLSRALLNIEQYVCDQVLLKVGKSRML